MYYTLIEAIKYNVIKCKLKQIISISYLQLPLILIQECYKVDSHNIVGDTSTCDKFFIRRSFGSKLIELRRVFKSPLSAWEDCYYIHEVTVGKIEGLCILYSYWLSDSNCYDNIMKDKLLSVYC